MADFVAEFTLGSHHICPGNLTDTTELGKEVDARIAQPLAEGAQSDSKADQTKDSKEEANQDSPTNKDLVHSDNEGQTASMDLKENTSDILAPPQTQAPTNK